jgi:agmatinase
MNDHSFLGLPASDPSSADVLLLPLPFEGTACYGKGTAKGPQAVWQACTHIELWDEELDFEFNTLKFHSAESLSPLQNEQPGEYLDRVFQTAKALHEHSGMVVGVGGEHSLTPPLVSAAVTDSEDLSNLTVVQIDAHSDLRDEYEGTKQSHACAMRRIVEKGANVIAVGIRSADREEFEYGTATRKVRTFFAQQLAEETEVELQLLHLLSDLRGDLYLTIDIDGLELSLCPGTGTPQPGGLGWWQTLRYLRHLLHHNPFQNLLGCDLVETVPIPNTHVNEFTAAKLLAKVIAYQFTG